MTALYSSAVCQAIRQPLRSQAVSQLPRIPKRRSSRWRESLYSPTPIGPGPPARDAHNAGYYVSYVQFGRLVVLVYIRQPLQHRGGAKREGPEDRKSTRLNSSHANI